MFTWRSVRRRQNSTGHGDALQIATHAERGVRARLLERGEWTDLATGYTQDARTAAAADEQLPRGRADHRERREIVLSERQRVPLVAEQDSPLLGNRAGLPGIGIQRERRDRTVDHGGAIRRSMREQTEPLHRREDVADRPVQGGDRHGTALDRGLQVVEVRAEELDVQSRLQCWTRTVVGAIVGHHEPGEAPPVAQDVGEQRRVLARELAVDRVVRAHDRAAVALPDRGLEPAQLDLVQGPLVDVDVHALSVVLLVVLRVVLGGGDRPGRLDAVDLGDDQVADQEGILTQGLEVPAGLRYPHGVDHRCEDDILVARTGVPAEYRAVIAGDLGAERGGQRHRRRHRGRGQVHPYAGGAVREGQGRDSQSRYPGNEPHSDQTVRLRRR